MDGMFLGNLFKSEFWILLHSIKGHIWSRKYAFLVEICESHNSGSYINSFVFAAFAPMNAENDSEMDYSIPKNEPFDINRYISESDEDWLKE